MWPKSLNILQVALNCIALIAVLVSLASLAGVVDTSHFFPNLVGNELITILFSLAYLSWWEDKKERREDKEEMVRIRREDKEETALNRREDKQEMAALRQNMTATSIITTFISLASAISSVLYTYFTINSK